MNYPEDMCEALVGLRPTFRERGAELWWLEPCEVCGERCSSQVHGIEHPGDPFGTDDGTDGVYWSVCSGCFNEAPGCDLNTVCERSRELEAP